MQIKTNTGFTLLELSIVIVIIGLIVAGISAGQSLVRQASLRGIASDFSQYKVALNSFKLQYDAWPGDMVNASDYWGAACGGASAAPTGCNGNGNKLIQASVSNGVAIEEFRAWQHLALAGLTSGTYTGEISSGGLFNGGENVPRGSIPNSAWSFRYASSNHNSFTLTSDSETTSTSFDPILTPAESYAVDVKLDNGIPNMTFSPQDLVSASNGFGGAGNCYTGSGLSSVYNLSYTETDGCAIHFRLPK